MNTIVKRITLLSSLLSLFQISLPAQNSNEFSFGSESEIYGALTANGIKFKIDNKEKVDLFSRNKVHGNAIFSDMTVEAYSNQPPACNTAAKNFNPESDQQIATLEKKLKTLLTDELTRKKKDAIAARKLKSQEEEKEERLAKLESQRLAELAEQQREKKQQQKRELEELEELEKARVIKNY